MAEPGGPPAAGSPLLDSDPDQVGSYRLLRRLGHGGMGVVYLGRDAEQRLVAVKVIRPDLARDQEFRARFRREVTNASRVPRFCTAAVLDADPDGEPAYLVTDYVAGPTLAEAVNERGPLPPADLEQLAISVATALTVIHRAGVIHRDLKPANVLLSPTGARVIDFGIARALDAATSLSRDLQRLGTPAFMAPEQVRGAAPSPAVDIFAWGGIVVYAGTGRLPFGGGPAALLPYRILTDQPTFDGLDGHLRPIVAAAMDKDPAGRPTATELYNLLVERTSPGTPHRPAPDVAAGATQPLAAPAGGVPAPTPAGGVPAPTPAGGAGSPTPPPTSPTAASDPVRPSPPPVPGPAGPSRRPGRRRVLLASATALAVIAAVTTGLLLTRQTGAPSRPGASSSLDVPSASRRLAEKATDVRVTDPALSLRLAVAAYRLSPSPPAQAALLAAAHNQLTHPATITGHTASVKDVAFSPDGKILATASDDFTARLWDVADVGVPRPLVTLTGHTTYAYGVAFAPDGKTLATTSYDGTARLWDITDPHRRVPLATLGDYSDQVLGVAFTPDGTTLATSYFAGTVKLWDVRNRRQPATEATLTGLGDGHDLAFSPDGRVLATAYEGAAGRLWDVSDRRRPRPLATLAGSGSSDFRVAFSPDGTTLATASTNDRGTGRLWDVTDRQYARSLGSFTGPTDGFLLGLAFKPNGKTVAAVYNDGTARLWDLTDSHRPQSSGVLTSDTSLVYAAAFSPDGRTLATAGGDATSNGRATAQLWDVDLDGLARQACARPAGGLTAQEWQRYLPALAYRPTCPKA